jgi:DNA-binding transcriptional regulator LsrR (DeoR family)
VYPLLGKAAADFLMLQLKDGLRIGMGWGRTLNGMVPFLRRSTCRGIEVVSLTGGLAANALQPNPYDVVSASAERLGAVPRYPLVPAVVESRQAHELLMREGRMSQVARLWKRIDIALVSIGSIAPDTGVYYSFPDPELEVRRSRKAGAVGDLLAVPYTAEGRFVKRPFLSWLIAIDFEDLGRIPVVAGVAGGDAKVPAILGALRTGRLNTLITDERCGRKILAMNRESKRGSAA